MIDLMEKEFIEWLKLLKDIIEIISFFATIFGMVALIVGFKTYRTSSKQLNVQVIVACSSRFHQILKKLRENPKNADFLDEYYGLCNEELFYFRHNYVPKEVAREWLGGMIAAVPHFVQGENRNAGSLNYTSKGIDLLTNYARLRYTFAFPNDEIYTKLKADKKAMVSYLLKRAQTWTE